MLLSPYGPPVFAHHFAFRCYLTITNTTQDHYSLAMSEDEDITFMSQSSDDRPDEPLVSRSCRGISHLGDDVATDIVDGVRFVMVHITQDLGEGHEEIIPFHFDCVTKAMALGWLYHRGELTDEREIDKCGETSITLKNIEQVSGGELKKEDILALAERMSKVTKLQAAFADVEGQWEMHESLSFSDRLTDEVRDSMTAEDMVEECGKSQREYVKFWDSVT